MLFILVRFVNLVMQVKINNLLLLEYIHDWKRVSLCLACQPYHQRHTGENMAAWVTNTCLDWNVLAKLDSVTTDTASNMKAMMKHLPLYVHHLDWINHVLQLSINVSLNLKYTRAREDVVRLCWINETMYNVMLAHLCLSWVIIFLKLLSFHLASYLIKLLASNLSCPFV